MNYIKMLEAKVTEQRLALHDVHRRIQAFQRLLDTHKFQGQEINNITCPLCRGCFERSERKDWIATNDVRAILQGIDDLTGGESGSAEDGRDRGSAGSGIEHRQRPVPHVPNHQ